jgi:hypothetical protein
VKARPKLSRYAEQQRETSLSTLDYACRFDGLNRLKIAVCG